MEFRNRLEAALREAFNCAAVPGFGQLGWTDRQRLNLRAFRGWLRSGDAVLLALWLIVAGLAVQIVTWHFDLGIRAAVRLTLLQAVWVGPWVARARRRELRKLLKHRWPG
jgi:hypothetical protein